MPQDASSGKVFLDYNQEDLDWQYDHSKRFDDTSGFNKERAAASARARDTIKGQLDVPYGDADEEKLDIFPAEGGKAPIVIFFHGGAWQRGSKSSYSFPAETFVPRGVTWIATDFINIPPGSLDQMVKQNRDAVAWVYRNAESFGGDPDRIFIAGHSSGGHMCGMVLVTDWEKRYGLPKDVIKGATAISGMYDLEAVWLSYRNNYLKLDEEGWRRASAIHNLTDYGAELIIGCGEFDTEEFHRQPLSFLDAWKARGYRGEFIELMGSHHFAASKCFNDPDGPLVQKMLKMIGV